MSGNSSEVRYNRWGFEVGEEDPDDEVVLGKKGLEKQSARADKYLVMIRNWDTYTRKKPKKVSTSLTLQIRERFWKGIPNQVRGRLWSLITDAEQHRQKNPNLMSDLLKEEYEEHLASLEDDQNKFIEDLKLKHKLRVQTLEQDSQELQKYIVSIEEKIIDIQKKSDLALDEL